MSTESLKTDGFFDKNPEIKPEQLPADINERIARLDELYAKYEAAEEGDENVPALERQIVELDQETSACLETWLQGQTPPPPPPPPAPPAPATPPPPPPATPTDEMRPSRYAGTMFGKTGE